MCKSINLGKHREEKIEYTPEVIEEVVPLRKDPKLRIRKKNPESSIGKNIQSEPATLTGGFITMRKSVRNIFWDVPLPFKSGQKQILSQLAKGNRKKKIPSVAMSKHW